MSNSKNKIKDPRYEQGYPTWLGVMAEDDLTIVWRLFAFNTIEWRDPRLYRVWERVRALLSDRHDEEESAWLGNGDEMKSVAICGVGALGSHLVMLMRNMNVNLILIDFDRVESKNVMSQLHAKTNVGKNKTVALQQTMNFLFGTKVAVTIPNRLTKDNVKTVLSDADLVIDCFDNGESRRLVQSFVRGAPRVDADGCHVFGIPCLHGALDANGSFGRVVWDANFAVDDESSTGAATCEDGANLPFISIVSSYLARAAQVFLATGQKVGFEVHAGGATRT